MYKIVRKKELNAAVTLMDIEAPFIARKAKAGQFIIFRIDELGERVPLPIAAYDRVKGTVTIIFQKVGFATIALGNLNEGDFIRDFVGPLGLATELPEGTEQIPPKETIVPPVTVIVPSTSTEPAMLPICAPPFTSTKPPVMTTLPLESMILSTICASYTVPPLQMADT